VRLALDTNILAYSEDLERVATDAPKITLSRRLLRGLITSDQQPVVAVQALAELHRLLVRRAGAKAQEASLRVRRLATICEVVSINVDEFQIALELAADHGLQIFDAIILATAQQARCDLLMSEDLQDGFSWRGLTVCNPFGERLDPRVTRIIAAVS
jgi:predicted nucleic acid-binding protein